MKHEDRNERDLLHERLCAYALGESDLRERAALEEELTRSAELRAELERVRATLALVRDGLAGREEKLSEEALASVFARGRTALGERRGLRRLTGARLGRVAAGFALVALGLVVWAEWERRHPAEEAAPFAYHPFGAEVDGRLAKQEERIHGRARGLLDGMELGEQAASAAAPAQEPVLKDTEVVAARLSALGYGDSSGGSGDGVRMPAPGGHKGPGDTLPPQSSTPVAAAGGVAGKFGARMGGRVELRVESGSARDTIATRSRFDQGPPADATLRFAPGEQLGVPATSGDEFFLGRHAKLARQSGLEALKGLGYTGEGAGAAASTRAAIPYRELPEAERSQVLLRTCDRYLQRCAPLPNEGPGAMFFRFWGDNPFVSTRLEAVSTFAADVDTASWPLSRNYLRGGLLPPREAVRTEEFLNSFRPELAQPRQGTFAVHAELAPSRFGGEPSLWMLSVALKGREIERHERKPLALTFVVDVSGSMASGNRIGLVQHALRLLAAQLDTQDSIALVAFSHNARLLLPKTSASRRAEIESAVQLLRPEGSTNAEAGLKLGYEIAAAGLDPEATNRVVLLSDGVANVGETDQARILADVARQRAQGIYLNTIGVGMGNHDDAFLEQLADRGDGIASYVDDEREARKALVEDFVGKLETIARDVKLQLEFDPARVLRWRQLGYENRALTKEEFRDDAVDAGEVGAGHAVVALYELELAPGAGVDPLATVRVRWKPPFAPGASEAERVARERAEELAVAVGDAHRRSFEGASAGYQRLVVVAQLAELLRRSVHAKADSLEDFVREAEGLAARSPRDEDLAELVTLVRASLPALRAARPPCDALCGALEELCDLRVRQAELERLRSERDEALLDRLRRDDAALEARIRELVRGRLEEGSLEAR